MSEISIKILGIEKIQAALKKYPSKITQYLSAAGKEAGTNLLELEGLKKYPPRGPWNQPPAPYYKRGQGMQYKSGNSGTSERMGTQWYIEKGLNTTIGNRASYAHYLHGEEGEGRVYWATSHGWRALFDTAKRYAGDITKTYQAWVDKLIKDLGL